jgi:hypothetical protein
MPVYLRPCADSSHDRLLHSVHREDHTRRRYFWREHSADNGPAHPVRHRRRFPRRGVPRPADAIAVQRE